MSILYKVCQNRLLAQHTQQHYI